MKEILFKVKDNKLNIIVDDKLTNKEFLSLLKIRLEKLIVLKEALTKHVVLNIEGRSLDNREILQLFDILQESDTFYLSKVNCLSKDREMLTIYKGNIRGGQVRFFDRSLLLIGSINKGSKIIVEGNLYVLGVINGDIEIKDKKGKIYCEFINNSLIKIGDTYKVYSQRNVDKEIYLENKEIKEKDYKKGEIINYGKSNSSYIG